jgi:chemotaxis methyl-accepting protein methylase
VFSSQVDIKFDVVRCMNTITRKYFTRDRIGDALSNLGRSLKPSGVLLIGRTLANGRNDATFFRLAADRFVAERVVNEGADIHEIVENVRFKPDSR